MGFLLLMGIIVIGIVVTNFVQVTNAARDGARVAAICAGEYAAGNQQNPTIPDGSGNLCTVANVDTYVTSHLTAVPAAIVPTIDVCAADGTNCQPQAATNLIICSTGALLQVQMAYEQPLYLPLVSSFFETSGNGMRTLQSQGEATCE